MGCTKITKNEIITKKNPAIYLIVYILYLNLII